MRKFSKISKWFPRLFALLLSFLIAIFAIFLFRPEYFIDDIEEFIRNTVIPPQLLEVSIGSIEGNFVEGFNLNNIYFKDKDIIIISAGEIYIDPDLSRILTGTIALSEVIIHNAFYHVGKMETDEKVVRKNKPFFQWDFDITSLIIENSIIIYRNSLYELSGEVGIEIDNGFRVDIAGLNVQSTKFPSALIIPEGTISWYKNQIVLTELKSNSEWIAGRIDGSYNLTDFSKTSGRLSLDKLTLNIREDSPISAHNMTVIIKNINEVTMGSLKGDFTYKDIDLKDIHLKGNLQENIFYLDSASVNFNGEIISSTGEINVEALNWHASVFLNEINLNDNTSFSGSVNMSSPYLFEEISGDIDFNNTIINTIEIQSISGDFQFNNGVFTSDVFQFSANGCEGQLRILSLTGKEEFNISSIINFNNFDLNKIVSLYGNTSLNGMLELHMVQNNNSSNISTNFVLKNGTLFDHTYQNITGDAKLNYIDGEYKALTSGIVKGFKYDPYDWDSTYYQIRFSNKDTSIYFLNAFSLLGDTLQLKVEHSPNSDLYIPVCEGVLKQSNFNVQPFYVVKNNNQFHFPSVNIKLGDGRINIVGNYLDKSNYDFKGILKNLNLFDIYSILGHSYRLNGQIKNGDLRIETSSSKDNPYPIIFSSFELVNGNFDEILFESLNISASYRNRRFLLNQFNLETNLGKIRGDGWFHSSLHFGESRSFDSDNLDLSFDYENVDLSKFNRYFPWGLESKGFMTGTLNIEGTVSKPEISSELKINNPGFDKIDGKTLQGKIYYKNKRLDFRNVSLVTESGRYSGFGYVPTDLNLILSKREDISQNPLDFVFTGTTNNIEFLPPYFNLLDSLTSTKAENDTISSYTLELLLTGTLSNPIRNGWVIIRNGTLFMDPINEPIENINGKLSIHQNKLIIDNLTASLNSLDESGSKNIPIFSNLKSLFSSDDIKNQNNMKITGSVDMEEFFNPNFAVHITGDNISLSSSYGIFNGKGSADISITGQDTMFIIGEFIPAPYEFNITSLGEKEDYAIENIYTNRIVSYNLHIPIKDGIKIETENINILFDGDISITRVGDEAYNFSGKADIIDGKFYDNQGNVFQNTYGNILFSPVDNTPYMDIHAQTYIDNNTIEVSFIGYTDDPALIFDSQDFTQTEILKMLTFGNQGDLDNPEQAGNLLSNYIENEIEKNITRYSDLDEFQLTSRGSLLKNLEGEEDIDLKLVLGKQLSNKIYINTQFDLDNIDKSQYEATYRLNQNTSIVGGLDENNLWHLSYRIKYYY